MKLNKYVQMAALRYIIIFLISLGIGYLILGEISHPYVMGALIPIMFMFGRSYEKA